MTYVSPDTVRHLVADACRTLARLPIPRNARPSENDTFWPEVLAEFHLAYGREPATKTRLLPSPAAIDRCEQMLPIIYEIRDLRMRKAVIARALGFPLRRIANSLGCSKDTVKRLDEQGIQAIALALAKRFAA